MRERWQATMVLALLAVMLGYVLGHGSIFPGAHAQGEGGAGNIICIVGGAGGTRNNNAPIVLIDTLDQTLVVYDYNYTSRNMYLKAARTYKYDKQLAEFNGSGSKGPSVTDVRRMLESKKKTPR